MSRYTMHVPSNRSSPPRHPARARSGTLDGIWGRQAERWAVVIYSEVARATTFKIYLPRWRGRPNRRRRRLPQRARVGQTAWSCEDEAPLRRLISRSWGFGYRVVWVGRRPRGLERWRVLPNLLLTDIILPGGMRGTTWRRSSRHAPRLGRALHVRAPADAIVHDGASTRASTLGKPFTPEALRVEVRTVLDSHSRT